MANGLTKRGGQRRQPDEAVEETELLCWDCDREW